MGNSCNCCKKKIKKNIVLLLIGLDNAGKTVAAKGLARESIDSVVPTVGFSVINLSYMKYTVKIFDLGGGPSIRGIWHKYFVDAYGLIFVVDSSDVARLEEAKRVLHETLSHEKISGKPVLLLANKQDSECALDEVDIVEKLDLEFIVNSKACPTLVKSCVAADNKVDANIKSGYEWLLNYISRNYEHLNKRVEVDVAEQNAVESRIRLEKIEKIRAMKEAEQRNRADEDAIESYSNYERKMNGQLIANESRVNVESDEDSESSFRTFTPVCHLKDENVERPKSATELVSKQLQLNTVNNKRKYFISRVSNKTAPLQLYDGSLPRPATVHGTRDKLFTETRLLRSADGRTESMELPEMPLHARSDEYDKEFYTLFGFRNNKVKTNMLKINGKDSDISLVNKSVNGDMNGISVIDVE